MARRFARRRKPRVVWLPVFGQGHVEGATVDDCPGITGRLNFDSPAVVFDAFPITFDQGNYDPSWVQEQALVNAFVPNVSDLTQGNEYRLRRIVGKFFCAASSDELDDPPAFAAAVDCALGFIICRTDDDGAPTTDFEQVNPLAQGSMNDPWIWRRRWVLNPFGNTRIADPNISTLNFPPYWDFPNSTAGYGSVQDGPHIDQKTARIIRKEERLFAVVAARGWFPTGSITNGLSIDYLLDYRILASMRSTTAGNRRNASR